MKVYLISGLAAKHRSILKIAAPKKGEVFASAAHHIHFDAREPFAFVPASILKAVDLGEKREVALGGIQRRDHGQQNLTGRIA